MSRECQVTGKKPLVGSNVSHSNRHTKRRFEVNLTDKRFWLEDEKRWITLARLARAACAASTSSVCRRSSRELRARGEKL